MANSSYLSASGIIIAGEDLTNTPVVINGTTSTFGTLLGAAVPATQVPSASVVVQAVTASGAALSLPFTAGAQETAYTVTLAHNTTITLGAGADGQEQAMTVDLVQSGSGGFVATFSGVSWPGDVAPTLNTAVGKVDTIKFRAVGSDVAGQPYSLARTKYVPPVAGVLTLSHSFAMTSSQPGDAIAYVYGAAATDNLTLTGNANLVLTGIVVRVAPGKSVPKGTVSFGVVRSPISGSPSSTPFSMTAVDPIQGTPLNRATRLGAVIDGDNFQTAPDIYTPGNSTIPANLNGKYKTHYNFAYGGQSRDPAVAFYDGNARSLSYAQYSSNAEGEHYSDPTYNGINPFGKVLGGGCTITARLMTLPLGTGNPNGHVTSSGLLRAFNPLFTNAYFEFRGTSEDKQGMWPAYWLYNSHQLNFDGIQGTNFEIDTLEGWSNRNPNKLPAEDIHNTGFKDFHQNSHGSSGGIDYTITTTTSPGIADAIHTYGSLITRDYIIQTLDGIITAIIQTPAVYRDNQVDVLINLATGFASPDDNAQCGHIVPAQMPYVMTTDRWTAYAATPSGSSAVSAVPDAPSFTVTPGDLQAFIDLRGAYAVPAATSFKFYAGTDQDNLNTVVSTGSAIIGGISNTVPTYFQATATNSVGTSARSPVYTIQGNASLIPNAPGYASVSGTTTTTISVQHTGPLSGFSPPSYGWSIYPHGSSSQIGGNVSDSYGQATFSGLAAGTSYDIHCFGVSSSGVPGPAYVISNVSTAAATGGSNTPTAPTITMSGNTIQIVDHYTGVNAHKIFVGTSPGGINQIDFHGDDNGGINYSIPGLTAGSTYYAYVVPVVYGTPNVDGPQSNTVSFVAV